MLHAGPEATLPGPHSGLSDSLSGRSAPPRTGPAKTRIPQMEGAEDRTAEKDGGGDAATTLGERWGGEPRRRAGQNGALAPGAKPEREDRAGPGTGHGERLAGESQAPGYFPQGATQACPLAHHQPSDPASRWPAAAPRCQELCSHSAETLPGAGSLSVPAACSRRQGGVHGPRGR